jgi:hypothetical protein
LAAALLAAATSKHFLGITRGFPPEMMDRYLDADHALVEAVAPFAWLRVAIW